MPNSRIIEDVVLGADGVLEGLEKGAALIDMSSAEPASTRKLHKILGERGVDMLDAAISGGPAGAAVGQMSIMVGGEDQVFQTYKPVLDVLGNNVRHVGGSGAGHTLKAVNNLLYGAIFVASCEAVVLGVKCGLDAETLVDVISASSGRNFAVDVKFKGNVLKRDFNAGFSTDLLGKDMDVALSMARENHFPVSVCSFARDIITKGQLEGYGKLDHTAVVKMYEELAGLEVK